MGELLDTRRKQTSQRLEKLKEKVTDARKYCDDVACVYITGSFARGEASQHSDLDLFIVGETTERGGKRVRALSNLDEIIVKADLISATRDFDLPEFSNDGAYLEHYTSDQLITSLGKPDDDVTNTFTARLLLLLESLPLVGEAVYKRVIQNVVAAYWRDYEGRKDGFMPAFLANDILRMWRTFCINYEARTRTAPDSEKAKRKLKNYKLKHSRLLTCYSALLYFAAVYATKKTVSPADAQHMISLTPSGRIEWMASQQELESAHGRLKNLLGLYEKFLESTDAPEAELIARFMDRERREEYSKSAYEFGDVVFELLEFIGQRNRFHRLLVV